MKVYIFGQEVTIEELQDEVLEARRGKRAFTPETVQALIDKLNGMVFILKDALEALECAELRKGINFGYESLRKRYDNFV
jgi:hypothetical protein